MKGHKKGQRTKDFRIKPNRPCKNIDIKHCKWEELPTFNRLWHQKKKSRKKIWHQKMKKWEEKQSGKYTENSTTRGKNYPDKMEV